MDGDMIRNIYELLKDPLLSIGWVLPFIVLVGLTMYLVFESVVNGILSIFSGDSFLIFTIVCVGWCLFFILVKRIGNKKRV